MSLTTPRLSVRDLRVELARDHDPVVHGVSFDLFAGETLGLVGESGSGKTTVALAMLSYVRHGLKITGGEVLVDGVNVLSLTPAERRKIRGSSVAYMPQDPGSALNPALKVGTQLREVFAGRPSAAVDERLERLLSAVRLQGTDVLCSYPHQLSGGQQQRVVLAMAFARNPGVIVLDEPTTGLDVSTQRHILDTIRHLCRSEGVAAIFVSHDLAVIGEMADRVALMYAGRIVETGPNRTIFEAPMHPYTRHLLRAVPSIDRSGSLVGLDGHQPDPGERTPGCAFAARCERFEQQCSEALPALEPFNESAHLVRCRRVREPAASSLQRVTVCATPDRTEVAHTLLSCEGLSARYEEAKILSGVSWSMRSHECVAIVGESGAGKSTLARCLVGLHHNWSGSIGLEGEVLAPRARDRSESCLRRIQYISQNPYSSLNPRRRVREIIEQPLRRFFRDDKNHEYRVQQAMEAASLPANVLDQHPTELSGGQRQRVAIARALVVDPHVLVCDEVTSALDVSVQASVIESLRDLQLQRGLALVFITHNLALVRSIANRVIVMKQGRIVEIGDCLDLLEAPKDSYTQELIRDIPRLPPPSRPGSSIASG